MKIAVCVPCYGDPKFQFTASLVDMAMYSARRHELAPMMFQGQLLEARNWLAEQALTFGADWMLWLDADQTFPRNTLERLLAHDLDVVGCNYPMRKRPTEATAVAGNARLVTTEEKAKAGLVEPVASMALGVCLMRPGLFERLPKPWFTFAPVPGQNAHMSEDAQLFYRLAQLGVRAHVDHSLSWEVGHLGETVHTNTEVANVHSIASSAGGQQRRNSLRS